MLSRVARGVTRKGNRGITQWLASRFGGIKPKTNTAALAVVPPAVVIRPYAEKPTAEKAGITLSSLLTKNALSKLITTVEVEGPPITYTAPVAHLTPVFSALQVIVTIVGAAFLRGYHTNNRREIPSLRSILDVVLTPENIPFLSGVVMGARTNFGGTWKRCTEHFAKITNKVKTELDKLKPNNIEVNYDHIVPRQEVTVKLVLMVLKSLEIIVTLDSKLSLAEYDKHFADKVKEKLPSLEALKEIEDAFRERGNFRILAVDEHKKYNDIGKHEINPLTQKPYTMFEKCQLLKRKNRLPRTIEGYTSPTEVDNKEQSVQNILQKMLDKNEEICNKLQTSNIEFVRNFAENMRSYFRMRVGLQSGGGHGTISEDKLYEIVVQLLDTKGLENISNAGENERGAHYRILQDELDDLSLIVFKFINVIKSNMEVMIERAHTTGGGKTRKRRKM